MGASSFTTGVRKGADMQAVYRAACAEAAHEFGHETYSGTINTTSGVCQSVHSPMTARGAAVFAENNRENAPKWGPAFAIPVATVGDFTFSATKLEVELPPVIKAVDEWDVDRATSEWDLRDAAFEHAFNLFGHRVHDVVLVPKIKTGIVVETAEGRPQSRYQIVGRGKLFTTKRDAISAAKDQLAPEGVAALRIQAVQYWPAVDSLDAVVVSKRTVSATAAVTVTLADPRPTLRRQPAVVGWVFYGMAAE